MKGTNAVLYFRVSTDEQAESGLGLEGQRTAALAYVAKAGLTVRAEFTDAGVSGSTEIAKREGLTAALAAVKRGDVLLVAKRDRLARDMFVTLTVEKFLESRGARLVSAAGEGTTGENDLGAMIQRTLFDLFGQVEREMIRERTRRALAAKKARGERVGSIPYGFRLGADGAKLEADEHEQQIAREIKSLRNNGHTFRGIVAHLNTNNILSRKGKQWHLSQVQNVLNARQAA